MSPAKSWMRIKVVLLSGRGEELDPIPDQYGRDTEIPDDE